MSRASCKGCKYLKSVNKTTLDIYKYCNYIIMTGRRRPCPAGECRKAGVYEPAVKKKRGRPRKDGEASERP